MAGDLYRTPLYHHRPGIRYRPLLGAQYPRGLPVRVPQRDEPDPASSGGQPAGHVLRIDTVLPDAVTELPRVADVGILEYLLIYYFTVNREG